MVANTGLNYQNWAGMSSEQYGYGSMRAGFRNAVPDNVRFDGLASVSVWIGTPDSCPGFLDGSTRVLSTMWETDTLPDRWVRFLSEFDQIIVPCEHNRVLFSQHHPNVSVVPLGFDPEIWHPCERGPNERFRFHAGGSLWRRKGLDLVVEAFLALDVDAELHIKVAPHCQDMPKIAGRDDIVVHRQWMSEQGLVAWVRQADCWVAPSRGEGFGLMPLQAIACSIPTIVSDTSGHREYSHLATRVVPTNPVSAPDGGMWDEPEPEALALAMLALYEDAHKAPFGTFWRPDAIDQFSWVNASQRLLEALPVGRLLADTTRWVPCQPMVTVTVDRDVSPHVAGRTFTMQKGVTQLVPDNVAEVLKQAGFLIP